MDRLTYTSQPEVESQKRFPIISFLKSALICCWLCAKPAPTMHRYKVTPSKQSVQSWSTLGHL